jgi:CRP/FNR family transcriptional regulator, cyclic AMP receptor protein
MEETRMDEKRLRSAPLFAELGKKERKALATRTDRIEIPEGKQLATEGDFAYEFFVITRGTAEVVHEGEHLADLGPGDFFGEIGILSSERRTATVTATSPMECIVMTEQALRSLHHEDAEVARRLEQAIEQRLTANRG